MQIRLLSSHSLQRPRHPSRLVEDLSTALRDHGHQVDVDLLTGTRDGHEPATLREGAAAGRKLADQLGEPPSQPRVLHALDPVAWAAALTARSRVDVAVVLRFTGSTTSNPAAGGTASREPDSRDPTASLTERRAQRACLRAADAIAATADGDREAAVRAGVAGDRALVVPDLVGMLSRPGSGGVRPPGRVLVSLGGIGPDSGIDAVLTAMRSVPGRELMIAGPGSDLDADRFQATLTRLGLEHRVHWLGWLDRPAAARLIDAAAIIVCPSPGAGAVGAVEAMARSRAVATVAGGRTAEIVVDGVTGVVVGHEHPDPLGPALHRLLKNPFQLEAMGLAARERALTLFAPDRAVTATERAYLVALGAA